MRPLKPRVAGFFALQAPEAVREKARRAARELAGQGWKVLAAPVLKAALKGLAPSVGLAALARRSSVIVSLGGDGTLLKAAHLAAPEGKPLVGVNLGSLGFMSALGPAELATALPKLLAGEARLEERAMLRAELWRGSRLAARLDALNEVAVVRSRFVRLARLPLSVDGRFLAEFRADGLIIATPSGSTAYALSVGGPIVDTGTQVLLVAPVSPHTLSNRPIVLPCRSELGIGLLGGGVELSADGGAPVSLRKGDRLRVALSPLKTRLLFPPQHDAYAVLRDKLGWQAHALPLGAGRRA